MMPVTIQQAKSWLKVDDDNSDAEILGLIQAATLRAESICQRPFIQREYTENYDSFPTKIKLDKVKVKSITSVNYSDGDDADQIFTDYDLSLGDKYKQAILEANSSWPATYDKMNAVSVVYQAGYGLSWNDVPETVRIGILFLVSHYFTNRGIVGDDKMLPETVYQLLNDEMISPL
jgi:uncharacterized phiE125 gp8 family phage protein